MLTDWSGERGVPGDARARAQTGAAAAAAVGPCCSRAQGGVPVEAGARY